MGTLNGQIAAFVKNAFGSQLGHQSQAYVPLIFYSFLVISFFNLTA